MIPFDGSFAAQTAQEFIDHVLVERLGAEHVSVGENFRFGNRARGDADAAARAGRVRDARGRDGRARRRDHLLDPHPRARRGRRRRRRGALPRRAVPHARRRSRTATSAGARSASRPPTSCPTHALVVPDHGIYACRAARRRARRTSPPSTSACGRPSRPAAACSSRRYLLDFDGDIYGQRAAARLPRAPARREALRQRRGAGRADGPRRRRDPPHRDVTHVRDSRPAFGVLSRSKMRVVVAHGPAGARPRLRGRRSCYPASPQMTAITSEEKARARREVRQDRERHRRHRGPDRAAHRADQPSDRAPARAQARPPLAPRPADARRPPPPLPELPAEEGPRGLPLADPRARPAPLARVQWRSPPASRRPDFSLARADGAPFTHADLLGTTTVLVFYPFAFSPVCTDQLSVYNELLDEFAARGATLYGVSCDAVVLAAGVPRAARDRHRAAVGLRAQGRRVPRVRRAAPGAGSRSARWWSSGPTAWCNGATRPRARRAARREPDLRRAGLT